MTRDEAILGAAAYAEHTQRPALVLRLPLNWAWCPVDRLEIEHAGLSGHRVMLRIERVTYVRG